MMKLTNEMSNVNISKVLKDLTTSTLSFHDLWYSFTGAFPCTSCLTMKLLEENRTNLLNFMHSNHDSSNFLNNQRLHEELKSYVSDQLAWSPIAFSWKHNTSNQQTTKNNRGCNWRKSGWAKKYCECFQAKIPCSQFWKCVGCKNCDHKENQTFHNFLDRSNSSGSTLTASSYIESLSLSLLKNLESSNNRVLLSKDSKSLDPLNSLWTILNTRHDISNIPSLPTFKKSSSCFSESNCSGHNSFNVKNLVSSTDEFRKTLLNTEWEDEIQLQSLTEKFKPKSEKINYVSLFSKLKSKVGHKFFKSVPPEIEPKVEEVVDSLKISQNKNDLFAEHQVCSKLNDCTSADSDSLPTIENTVIKRKPLKLASANVC